MSTLAKASVSAVKWSTATTIGRFMLQLIAQVVLARMLGPDVYGIFGMSMVVYNFAYFIATFGFAWSLGQLEEVTEEDIRFAFTWQVAMGLVAGLGLYFSADLAGEYFKDPRVIPVVKWMSVVCVLCGLSALSGYLMNRDLNFKAPGIIQLFSYFVGYICVGIPCAHYGLGVNALLAAWLSQAITATAITICVRPHAMKPLWTSPQAGRITRIGATGFFTNLVNWACNNIDRGVIGRSLTARDLGFYNAGYNLANMPNSLLISALQPVFLRVGARMQGQKDGQAKAFGEILGIIWVLLLPAFFSLALTAPYLIQLFYGDTWHAAGPVLSTLFLGMPAYVMWGMSTPVLWNMGRARYEMMLQLPLIPIAAAGYYAFASHGVFYAALVTSGLLLLRGFVVGGVAGHLVGIRLGFVFRQVARGAVFCALVYLTQEVLMHLLPLKLHALLMLILLTAAHAVVCVGCAWLFPRLLGPEAARLIVRFMPPLQSRLSAAP